MSTRTTEVTEPIATTTAGGRHATAPARSGPPADTPVGQRPQDIAAAPAAGEQTPPAASAPSGGLPVSAVLLFLVGCVLLVIAALSLTRLNGWMNDYGAIPVFVAFFLVMSLAGRWIWAGIDTLLTTIRANKQQ